jgi:hypothetical protein
MAGSEISRPFTYSPRSTEPPPRKRRVRCELAASVVPERHEHQLLVRGLPAEHGWVPTSISISITHPVREVYAFEHSRRTQDRFSIEV